MEISHTLARRIVQLYGQYMHVPLYAGGQGNAARPTPFTIIGKAQSTLDAECTFLLLRAYRDLSQLILEVASPSCLSKNLNVYLTAWDDKILAF